MDPALVDLALRWLHIVAAIVWLGHNYVNVILRPVFVPLAVEGPSGVPHAELEARSRREHAIFRWASVVTVAAGALLLLRRGVLVDALTLQGYYALLGAGAWIGIAMMLNVWLVLWPHQKKVLGFVAASGAERARCARITFLSSRINTVLSAPLLVLMIAGSHGGLPSPG
jgi:uncharacterized membrane protein